MTPTLVNILAVFAILYGSWMLFVFVMGLYRAFLKGRVPPWSVTWILGLPIVAVAFVLNALLNVTLASVLFLDPPRELQVTGRLKRYIEGRPGWRQSVANWVCTNMLDPLAPDGDHC